jgi:fructuronate reductase
VRLPESLARPGYDRRAQQRGIVHFGLGAFTRAHQAAYTDTAMTMGDADWMITGVSLRSARVAEQMDPQDGLYLIAEKSGAGTDYRLGSAIRDILVEYEDPEAVVAAIADPATRIVSFTVTEKGYCRGTDGSLDLALAARGSFYPLLSAAMRRRSDTGAGGLTLLNCDNLSGNGTVLAELMRQYLSADEASLRDWFDAECTCPSTMVDRIVPATTDADRAAAEAATGLRDEALVVTEPFSQWVVEDRFANGRPAWEKVGAQLVADVAPYETAKLRMLNGAHSFLAYCGLDAGHKFVHEAVADPKLRKLIERLMLEEAAPTIEVAPGQDLAAYSASLIERFANPALNHALIQIAMDGSQKIPQRWLETLAVRQAQGLQSPAILTGLAAWLRHVRGDIRAVDDPLAKPLMAAWEKHGVDGVIGAVFGDRGLVPSSWQPDRVTRLQLHTMVKDQVPSISL